VKFSHTPINVNREWTEPQQKIGEHFPAAATRIGEVPQLAAVLFVGQNSFLSCRRVENSFDTQLK
jgi:hypothetical protein